MSISVDDLVSSLSSSHIGQEALDLAALQAQLAQTLFAQSIASSSSSGTDANQPCNTPTGRTPSSSFSWGHVIDAQRLSRRNTDEMLDDAEDERMVEDILIPSSPVSAGSTTSPSFAIQQQLTNSATPRSQSKGTNRFSSPTPSPSPFGPETSSFTSTDPFYLAQLQAMQNHNTSSPPSVFSQIGRPAQQSPFLQRRDSLALGFSSSSISLETHNMFAATSVAFER